MHTSRDRLRGRSFRVHDVVTISSRLRATRVHVTVKNIARRRECGKFVCNEVPLPHLRSRTPAPAWHRLSIRYARRLCVLSTSSLLNTLDVLVSARTLPSGSRPFLSSAPSARANNYSGCTRTGTQHRNLIFLTEHEGVSPPTVAVLGFNFGPGLGLSHEPIDRTHCPGFCV